MWRARAFVVTLALSVAGYLLFTIWGGWREVVAALGALDLVDVLVLLGLSLINYGLRFRRWQRYLTWLGHRLPWRFNLHAYLAGFALTTTPGKAGEALRGMFLKPLGVPYTQSVGALFAERLSDLIAVVLLSLPGLWFYPPGQPWVIAALVVLPLGVWILRREALLQALRTWVQLRGWPRFATFAEHAVETVLCSGRLLRPAYMTWGLVLGLAAWGAEALAFYYLALQMGLDIALPIAFFIYSFSMLVGAISFLPGGLGSAEIVMALLLVLNGASHAEAASATLVIRLATLWFAVLIGVFALLRPPR
ncbi:MAG: lysylphosphatidylglycerol synthase transmembrane domain-containing protein [Gammaproteobacteria bacterium]